MAFGHKVGSFTVLSSASTNDDVSTPSLGFSPDIVILWSSFTGTTEEDALDEDATFSFGAYDGTNDCCVSTYAENNVGTSDTSRVYSEAFCCSKHNDSAFDLKLTGVSLDADTATFNIDVVPAADQKVYFLALGGVDAEIKFNTHKTGSTGTKDTDFVNTSLEAGLVIIGSVADANTTKETIQGDSRIHLGFAAGTGATDQFIHSYHSSDTQGTTSTSRGIDDTYIFRSLSSGNWNNSGVPRAAVSSITAGTVTLNYSVVHSSTAAPFFMIGVDGLTAEVFETTERTTNTTDTITTTIDPDVAFFVSHCGGSATDAGTARLSFGASDGTSYGTSHVNDSGGLSTSDTTRLNSDTYALYFDRDSGAGDSTEGRATADFSTANEITLTWTRTDGTARDVFGIALEGDAAAGVTDIHSPLQRTDHQYATIMAHKLNGVLQ